MRRIAFILTVLLALLSMAYLALFGDLPAPEALITRSSPDATKILDRHGRLLFEVLDPRAGRRTRVHLDQLPLHLRQAVIAVEDANFYQHPGVDIVGVARAAVQAFRAGHIVSGGSTITQQLARDLLLAREERESRSLGRKLREMFLALRLTQAYGKETILEMYLNEMYFGQLAYGVEAAAEAYFGKSARELDLAEAALLAGLIQSPAAYDPLVHLDAARERQRIVLSLMVRHGYLSQDQADQAFAEPLHFAPHGAAATVIRAPHFVSYVRSLLEAEYGPERVNRGGLQVVTTLDLDLQYLAEATIRQQLADLRRRTRDEGAPDFNVDDAALVALDPTTGEILAMVGSADYFDASIDGAVNVALANRQPGSAIKPITYAAAFSRDLTPASVFVDVPMTFLTREGFAYSPENYDRQWHGPITLRQALATSSNMVAVRVLDHIGLAAMLETARDLGITTLGNPERFGLAVTLGGGEVKLLELTAAYGAFANGGRAVQPAAILGVQDRSQWARIGRSPNQQVGDLQPPTSSLQRPTSNLRPAVSPQVAYLITSILSDDAARMRAFGEGSVLQLTRPAAAKTGTTTDFRDNWTVGYTPDLAVGVWVGNANNAPMYKTSGITGAGPIWHNFVEEALKDSPPRPFQRPDGLVDVEICETSGLLPTAACPRRRSEVLIAGTEPLAYDDTYRALAVDADTGLLWAEGCRGPRLVRVYRFLPSEAAEWGMQQGIPEVPAAFCDGRAAAELRPQTADSGPLTGGGPSSAHGGQPLAVTITSPEPGAVFALSPRLPAALQQVEIAARVVAPRTGEGFSLTLFVDSLPVATFARPPYRVLWVLSPGDHEVRAEAADAAGGRLVSAPLRFRVEEAEPERTGGQ